MWRVTFKGLWAKKLRLVTTAIAVMLGVAFMAGTLVLTDTMGRTFDNLFADVNKGTDAIVRAKEAFKSDFGANRGRIDASVLNRVRSVDGVTTADGFVQGYAQVIGPDGKAIGSGQAPTFGGSWGQVDALNPYKLVEGRPPAATNEMVIDRGIAKDGHFKLGDRARVLLQGPTQTFIIVGIATFGSTDSAAGSSAIFFTLGAAQQYVGEAGKLDSVSAVAQSGVSQTELKQRLQAAIPDPTTEVLTGAEITKENQSDIKKALSFFTILLLVFAGVALFVGTFIIYNTFSIIVAQRSREMALLRAIGASRRQVLRSVLAEGLVVGLVASAVGLGAGVAVAVGLKGLFSALGIDIPAGGIVLALRTVILAFVVGTGVTLVSALFPAWRAGRVPPIAAMRDVAIDRANRSVVRAVLGLVVLGLGVLLLIAGLTGSGSGAAINVGFSAVIVFAAVAILGPIIARPLSRLIGAPLPTIKKMTGTLARENAMRNPRRTASTAAALMIGVGIVGFILVMASSIKASIAHTVDTQLKADYIIDSGTFGNGAFSPALATEIAELPGAQSVSGTRFGAMQVKKDTKFVLAVAPHGILDLFDVGTVQGTVDDLAKPDSVVIDFDVAKSNGWTIGSTVPAVFAATGPKNLTLVGLFDGTKAGVNWIISTDTYDQNFTDKRDIRVYVKTAPGTDQAAFQASVKTILKDYPTAKLEDRTQFKNAQAGQINAVVNFIYAMLALAIIIALFGIANTLALSIFERTRELGLLRAVGMTRRQMRSSVRWESVIIALLGTMLGLVIGISFGAAIVEALRDQGFDSFAVPIGQLVIVTLIAVLAGFLAAVLPARRASRLDVLQAIATE